MGANLFKSFSFATLCVLLGLGASSGAAGWTPSGLMEALDSRAKANGTRERGLLACRFGTQ